MNADTSSFSVATPVTQQERIVIIDSLRGIAVLGILMMNIPYFALPSPASDNLAVNNELGTINQHVWYSINWFLEGSQRAIFSMLFGAGIILFITRLEKRIEGIMTAEYFIRRQLWLLFFGLVNAFVLLWPGDILFQYAICGIIVFAFRRLSVKALLVAAGISLVLMTTRENVDLFRQQKMISKGEAIAKLDTTRVKLTDQQKEELGAMTGFKEKSTLESKRKEMEKNLRQVRGSYPQVYENLSNLSSYFEFYYTYYGLWDILSFMFIGMAFYKGGILTGNAPAKIYWLLCIVGLGAGLAISYFRLHPLLFTKFNQFDYTKKIPFEYYEISRTFRSLGIFGLIMLLYKSGSLFGWLFKLMRPVGQMAFTNYLMQSLICAIYFYGFGFGRFGYLQRYEIYYVVAAIWFVEIIWSHIWLSYFRFGPLEWIWRSLTYWKRQPMKKNMISTPGGEKDIIS
ncbi:MAG: DUF418 domain-containing protein [Ferruginibacter sp.]|nr:DUF418 domain-containing protein [Ferruginibacter sp.]